MLSPATFSGKLLDRAINLAGFPPAPRALETINSSTSSTFIPEASITLFITGAANSFMRNKDKDPLIGDTTERLALTI
jgi:hypothetical protein